MSEIKTETKAKKPLNRWIAAAWAIFGGGFGCHHFYLRQWQRGIPYIVASILGVVVYLKIAMGTLKTQTDVMNFLNSGGSPTPAMTQDPLCIGAYFLMSLPSVVAFVEGLLYLINPKEQFDKKYNPPAKV